MVRASVALVVAALAVGACGDGDDELDRVAEARRQQAREVARQAELPPDVEEFLVRAAGAAGRSFLVEYAPDEQGQQVTLSQDPPARRMDVTRVEGTNETVRSVIVTGDGTFSCGRDAEGWECAPAAADAAPTGPFTLADIDRTARQLAEARAHYTLRIEERPVAGVAASCLVAEPRAEVPPADHETVPGVLCISPEGAPLLVEQRSESLRATRYRTTVDRDAFRLPAAPVSTTTTEPSER